ncbi:STAS domain-containing protein [Neobacillus notoginsengisoli]|uniref:STAS domain-containing protein n=1 Tax=Neobacillus notoginsengisoli TaxID=1578198 RepID=A0A417YS02_9BACI|nr:STAS domain-containing protein [Neobacillus notoginsengisoli]RHW38072.1 STAS domain-containing protein [Neobacillus notoginsengisoli]
MEIEQLKTYLSKRMEENSATITNDLIAKMQAFYDFRFFSEEVKKRTETVFEELVKIVLGGLKEKDVKESAFKWGELIGTRSIENNGDLGNTIKGVTIYKNVIWSFLLQEGEKVQIHQEDLLEVIMEIDHIFNMMVHGFSTAFTNNAEKLLQETRELYLKISVPIVPLSPKVAVLPLIGEINEMRSETLIVDSLDTCVKKRIETLVIDLSGVHDVDLIGIEVLFKLIGSLKLLGVKPIITGMKGDLSQTFIHLGIKLEGISIFSNLEQALKGLKFY